MNRKLWLNYARILLCILIILNVYFIFYFSAENADESSGSSESVTWTIAKTMIPGFQDKPAAEQEQLVEEIHPYIRKLAHMTEFGSLGTLVFLFLLTWKKERRIQYAISLGASLIVAVSDETSQLFSEGRSAQLSDVCIDFLGAFLCCSVILLIVCYAERRQKTCPDKTDKKDCL